jgi:hypothetical protein
MPRCSSCLCKSINNVPHTDGDILLYIQHRMSQVRKFLHHLPNDWPGAVKETELAHRADGLFIWASVACAFLQSGSGDPDIQLDRLLGAPEERVVAEGKLDQLFSDVLNCSLPAPGSIEANNWHYVVGSIVALKTPLTYRAMDSLLGLSAKHRGGEGSPVDNYQIKLTTSYYIISSLRPILWIDSEVKSVVRLLHKSVFDFLVGRADTSIRVDLHAQDDVLAMQCLYHLNQSLKYNICEIPDSSLLKKDIHGLTEQVHCCIPESLQYACCYFVYHLNDLPTSQKGLMEELSTFITQSLMYWIEAMSWLDRLYEAEICLQTLSNCLRVGTEFISEWNMLT